MVVSSCGTEAAYTEALGQTCSVADRVRSGLSPAFRPPDRPRRCWGSPCKDRGSLPPQAMSYEHAAMRFYWYWPHPHASASPLAGAMLQPGDELVVQALPSLRG